MRSWKAAVMHHHETRNSTSLSRSPRPEDGRSVSSGALTFRLARGSVPQVDAMPRVGGGKKGMKRLFAVAATVAVLVCGGASGAFAGEVTGPPNQLNNTNETGALDHANSICAASGLNDFDLSDPMGQTVSQVQTAADSWKYYGLPKGSPGTLGLCKGGTGEG
jgi:hypothetical protein